MAAVDLRASKTGYLTLDHRTWSKYECHPFFCGMVACFYAFVGVVARSTKSAFGTRTANATAWALLQAPLFLTFLGMLPRDRERMRPHRGRVRPPRAQFARGDLRCAGRQGRARGKAPRLLRGLLRVIGCTYCFCKYFVTYLQLTMAGSTSTRSAPRSRGASF